MEKQRLLHDARVQLCHLDMCLRSTAWKKPTSLLFGEPRLQNFALAVVMANVSAQTPFTVVRPGRLDFFFFLKKKKKKHSKRSCPAHA